MTKSVIFNMADVPYVYRRPENFQESLTTPTATFPEIFNGLLFRLSL